MAKTAKQKAKAFDENTMTKVYLAISDARDFLSPVVSSGATRIDAKMSEVSCPLCECGAGYGHSPKCEIFRMTKEALPMSLRLAEALKTFHKMEVALLEIAGD